MVWATVPDAPPTVRNQRATSWPAPISAIVPYTVGSRLTASALAWMSVTEPPDGEFSITTRLLGSGAPAWGVRHRVVGDVRPAGAPPILPDGKKERTLSPVEPSTVGGRVRVNDGAQVENIFRHTGGGPACPSVVATGFEP